MSFFFSIFDEESVFLAVFFDSKLTTSYIYVPSTSSVPFCFSVFVLRASQAFVAFDR